MSKFGVNVARILLALGLLALVGCGSSRHEDLRAFMDSERMTAGTRNRIEPLPAFPPYVAVVYSSAGLRSPFLPPRNLVVKEFEGVETSAPNPNRPKEYLERFNIAELKMVGTLERDGQWWALIKDKLGSVHRVTIGNYIGRNYGKVSAVTDLGLELTEVVVDGQGGWIERPRNLSIGSN